MHVLPFWFEKDSEHLLCKQLQATYNRSSSKLAKRLLWSVHKTVSLSRNKDAPTNYFCNGKFLSVRSVMKDS